MMLFSRRILQIFLIYNWVSKVCELNFIEFCKKKKTKEKEFYRAFIILNIENTNEKRCYFHFHIETISVKLFYFDPNTISEDSLMMLPIPKKAARNLIKYRSKGGVFSKSEDLKKIYGMDDHFNIIEPYIIYSTIYLVFAIFRIFQERPSTGLHGNTLLQMLK